MNNVGKNIKSIRSSKNMSQNELAEKLFVTRQTVSNYETGKSQPDIYTLKKLSEIFECDINELIYGIKTKNIKDKNQLITDLAILILLWVMYFYIPYRAERQHDYTMQWACNFISKTTVTSVCIMYMVYLPVKYSSVRIITKKSAQNVLSIV